MAKIFRTKFKKDSLCPVHGLHLETSREMLVCPEPECEYRKRKACECGPYCTCEARRKWSRTEEGKAYLSELRGLRLLRKL